jgi:hypothetical protein
MRITRKRYEKALKSVEAARAEMKLVKTWDDAIKRLGDVGNQQVIAVTISEDGSVRTECELVHGGGNTTPPQTKPQ